MGKTKQAEKYATTRVERGSYALYFWGQGICYTMVYMFLQTYALDIGISAYAFALIALIIKAWDAVNDPLFGVLLEKVHLKGGKYLPWIRISVAAIPITSVLAFAIPSDLSVGAKFVWHGVLLHIYFGMWLIQ